MNDVTLAEIIMERPKRIAEKKQRIKMRDTKTGTRFFFRKQNDGPGK